MKRTTFFNTSKSSDSRCEIFNNYVTASAQLERLLHDNHIMLISGPSFRMKDKLENVKEWLA